ncbi:hypothetical protein [Rhizobium sullae]|uniref:Uncharacterized protein n=1 Tax=Rhizobium sullae TaxID=50338 RepID=A0A4R3Q0L3_RHISU|nr:hypothetical protein [Rhizobium sullae]TCU08624.1 hypothetical protein EV132_12610 [Rhizobium sullae]
MLRVLLFLILYGQSAPLAAAPGPAVHTASFGGGRSVSLKSEAVLFLAR